MLTTDSLGSLDVGTPVLYRQVRVGSVQSYQFSRDQQKVVIGVHIEQPYAELVNSSSRFWNASGISLSGGLSGIEVRSESLQSLLAGGIAFETPDPQAAGTRKVPRFVLHKDRDSAIQRGTPIEIRLARGDGLSAGTPIRYKGLAVGQVDSVTLSDDLQSVVLRARITAAESRITRAGTQFWVVRPELGIMRTANLDTLVSGPYLEAAPGKADASVQTRFTGQEREPQKAGEGLSLVLSAARLGSIKPGNAVTYREVKVGEVTGYELGQNADRVLIRVVIEPRYAPGAHRHPLLGDQRLRCGFQSVQRCQPAHRFAGVAARGRRRLRHARGRADGTPGAAGTDLRAVQGAAGRVVRLGTEDRTGASRRRQMTGVAGG